jgi:hypothetical protein
MEDVTQGEELYIGMDMEWPVDRTSSIQGQVVVISIAYEKNVFLLQVCSSKHATSSSYHCSSSSRVVGVLGTFQPVFYPFFVLHVFGRLDSELWVT